MIIKETFIKKTYKCSMYIYSLTENTEEEKKKKNLTNCRK